jgi:hypothetical protein
MSIFPHGDMKDLEIKSQQQKKKKKPRNLQYSKIC